MSIKTVSLSGKKKIVVNKRMTFAEYIYLVEMVKGLMITIHHFFKKKVTIQYPEEQRPSSPVHRGRHSLKRDADGEHCTACGLCALACPAEAITMTSAERKPNEMHLYREEKYAVIYEINMLRCIFCGLCEEACPKDAIYLTRSHQLVKPDLSRESLVFGKKEMLEEINN